MRTDDLIYSCVRISQALTSHEVSDDVLVVSHDVLVVCCVGMMHNRWSVLSLLFVVFEGGTVSVTTKAISGCLLCCCVVVFVVPTLSQSLVVCCLLCQLYGMADCIFMVWLIVILIVWFPSSYSSRCCHRCIDRLLCIACGNGKERNLSKGIPIQCNLQQKRYVCVSAETVYGYRVDNEKQLCLRFRRKRERQGILVKESRFGVMYSKKGMSVCLLKLSMVIA
jgi:hypothetical protein